MSTTLLKDQWERRPIFSLAPRARQSVQSRSYLQSPSTSVDYNVRQTTICRPTSDVATWEARATSIFLMPKILPGFLPSCYNDGNVPDLFSLPD